MRRPSFPCSIVLVVQKEGKYETSKSDTQSPDNKLNWIILQFIGLPVLHAAVVHVHVSDNLIPCNPHTSWRDKTSTA